MVSSSADAGHANTSESGISPRAVGLAVVLALVVSLAIVVATFPANWVARWVEAKSGGRIFLADARGTLWHGSAVLGLSDGAGGSAPARSPKSALGAAPSTALSLSGRLEWQLRVGWGPASGTLPTGVHGVPPAASGAAGGGPTLFIEVTHETAAPRPLRLTLTRSAMQLDPGEVTLPLALSRAAGAPLNTLRLGGSGRLGWGGVILPLRGNLGPAPAAGAIELSGVTSAINDGVAAAGPLGDYRIVWRTVPSPSAAGAPAQVAAAGPARIEYSVQTVRGPLRVEGRGAVDPRGGSGFSGRAAIDPGTPQPVVQRLRPLLDVIGRRSGADGNEVVIQMDSR